MSLIRIDHASTAVGMNLPLNIITAEPQELEKCSLKERTVLYLLHGHSDDASAWQRYTCVESLARRYGITVVMPSGGTSFYTDLRTGHGYFSYITEELPAYLQRLLGIPSDRDKVMIAGNSMGGYGAFKAAFLRPELYSAAGSFSGMLTLPPEELLKTHPNWEGFQFLFGGLDELSGTEFDPLYWLRTASPASAAYPKLYMSCGDSDDIVQMSRAFFAASKPAGLDVVYRESGGAHNWAFWNTALDGFLSQACGG